MHRLLLLISFLLVAGGPSVLRAQTAAPPAAPEAAPAAAAQTAAAGETAPVPATAQPESPASANAAAQPAAAAPAPEAAPATAAAQPETPASANPAPEAAPAAAAAPATAPSRGFDLSGILAPVEGFLGGKPAGTGMYLQRHAEIAYVFGVDPTCSGNAPGKYSLSGLRYDERGGFLSKVLAYALAYAGAQDTANRTGRATLVHDEHAFDSNLGATVDVRSGQDNKWVARADLYSSWHLFDAYDDLPVPLDLGLTAGTQDGPMAAGVFLRTAIPVTRWAQVEGSWTLATGQASAVRFAGVVNGFNRFFARFEGVYGEGGMGYNTMLGVRL